MNMNNQEPTINDLMGILNTGRPRDPRDVDTSTLRYALYVRKSTRGDERQERSLKDQIKECTDRVIIPENLRIVKVVKEKFSAKESGTRKKFNALIEDIKAGRIDGIVAWHPDRLARNMKDSGEIIDLLDKGTLLDLRFPTFTFENTPSGKMLLGIQFVLSKEYSEHLSENVSRGNKRATEDDGVFIGKFKHGYYVDKARHLQPDERTFTLIQTMFEMRLAGKAQSEIREWINTQEYKITRKGKKATPFNFDKDAVSKLFRDPIYAGLLQWGENRVDLVEKYGFQPMISVSEFMKLNKVESLESVRSSIVARKRDTQADLLRGIVYCDACNKPMTSMIIPKGEKAYYYYRCETRTCSMRGKTARPNLILDAVQSFFSTHLLCTEDSYKDYLKDAKEEIYNKNQDLDSAINSAKKLLGQATTKYENTKMMLLNNPELHEHYDLDLLRVQVDERKRELSRLVEIRQQTKEAILPYSEYLKLFQSVPVILGKIHDMAVMDKFLKMFFSNFAILPSETGTFKGSEVRYKLNEPWSGFVNVDELGLGADVQTLHKLLHYLLDNPFERNIASHADFMQQSEKNKSIVY